MLTERDKDQIMDALHRAAFGSRICFIVPNDEAVEERLLFIQSLQSGLFLVQPSKATVRTRMSLGEIRFHTTAIDSRWCVGGLKGLEFDGVFVDETEPVPEEVFARVRKRNVKN